MNSAKFKKALEDRDIELLKKVPKGDVHNHSGLGMRFSTFNSYAGGGVTSPPKYMNGIEGLDNYIFDVTAKYVSNSEGIKFLIESTVKEAISDGIKVLESSIDAGNIRFFDKPQELFDFIIFIRNKYKNVIDFRPELGTARTASVEYWDDYVVTCIDSGIYKSIDLYGNEYINNMDLYKSYFNYASGKGMKIKAHAGEFCDSQHIIDTINILNPSEIQHGINCFGNSTAIGMIKERNIRLNICPSSNISLGAVKSIKEHPIAKLYKSGIRITINTDDLIMFDSGVSQEFMVIYDAGLLGIDELDEIRLNALL
jgi:adenosine deaminase